MQRRPIGRAAATAVATMLLVTTSGVGSAQAGLIGNTLGVVTGVVSGTTTVLTGTVGSLVGATGWIYDDSETTVAEAARAIGADDLYARGITGQGVGVAVIDTGIIDVPGFGSNVVSGPDLSFESQSDSSRYLDSFGHGTHMAGIIAGNDGLRGGFRGIAPGARLTSIKVGTSDGAVDVSQVIAAVDWTVVHRNDDPTNPIRVINLSYGTDGTQDYRSDPLTHAVENAWRAGIVVVVSAGNSGTDQPRLNNPAYDPYVLAVGASDTNGTTGTLDDKVPDFSSRGDAARRVDLVAPGRSIVSLRDPGSYIDEAHPQARVGTQYFKGSGSSQAAAVTSGAVALLLQARPTLTPDQVKGLLRASADPMPTADPAGRGQGALDVSQASLLPAPLGRQAWPVSTGLGSIEQARGTQHVADGDVELRGEQDVLGPWDAARWAPASAAFRAWVGGTWAGGSFTGDCWCATSWTGRAWAGRAWAGNSWSGRAWAGRAWAGRAWAGNSWSGRAWAGRAWAGNSWSGRAWASDEWGPESRPLR